MPASGRRSRRAEEALAPKGDAGHRNRRATKKPDGGGPPFHIFCLAKARQSFKEGPGAFARRAASLVSYILPVCAFLSPGRPTKSPGQNGTT